MVIKLSPELEAALNELAQKQKVTPESLALDALRKSFLTPKPKLEPRDEWERGLLAIGKPCGVVLSDEALGREAMYE